MRNISRVYGKRKNKMNTVYEKGRKYIDTNGTDLQKTVARYLSEEETKDELIETLGKYQNSDGGWANGLEIEYQGNVSTPMTTAVALSYIHLFDLWDTHLLPQTLDYLKTIQGKNGCWDDVKEIQKFNLPPYMGPGKYVEYKTGMNIKWLRRLDTGSELVSKALEYMRNQFPNASQTSDPWTAIAYINVFSEMPQNEANMEMLGWGLSVLNPSGETPPFEVTPWPMIQGMIHDDSLLISMNKEHVNRALSENQNEDGGWPHQFGPYNATWAAILNLRFIKKHGYA